MVTYRTRRSMNLSGDHYPKGTLVPEDVVGQIPTGRLRSLVNTGLFVEVSPMDLAAAEESAAQGLERCPICKKDFKRLAQHISMKHEDAEELENAVLGAEDQSDNDE